MAVSIHDRISRISADGFTRRSFLHAASAMAAGILVPRVLHGADPKEFRGIYPILQTPYTAANKVDFDVLEKEVKFLDKTGVHGVVWPQRASQYQYLTFEERIEGAERVVAANKGLRPKCVIGVQGPDLATAIKYAKHAAKLGPDAIIALPTRDQGEFDLDEVLRYYKAVADACGLPMFVQTTGNMSVDFVLKMGEKIPTIRFIKDEAGHTLSRIGEFAKHPDSGLTVFTGSHGATLIDEMMRGVGGNMPAAGWVDLYVKVWDHWHAGRKDQALEVFSKVMLFVTQALAYGFPSLSYVLYLRGVFKNWDIRGDQHIPLDDYAQKALRQTYEFTKPELVV